ncbi:MAG: GNAT family N-acetyltransferase [Arenimonas sp.]
MGRPLIQRRHAGSPWSEFVLLQNGRELLIRPIVPADAPALRAGFQVLSPEEVRLRFLHPLAELTDAESRRLASADPRREFVLVAAEPLPPGEALVLAVARASLREDSARDAEFALVVGRLVAGQGLGKLLLRRLLTWARRRRLHSLRGTVSLDNTVMLQLAQELGFTRQLVSGEPGTARIELDLHDARRKAANHGR